MNVSLCSRKSILEPCTTLPFHYQLDPYIGCEHLCCYCYGLNKADTDWEEEILIYEDLAGQLSAELDALEPQTIYMGMHSDPYQPAEQEYAQTRKTLELLSKKGFSVSLLTKSGLAARDIDLFKRMPSASVGISLAFSEDKTRKRFEKKAPSNAERIEALQAIQKAGIRTYALLCPVMPYLTEIEALIKMAAFCAGEIWVYGLEMHAGDDRNWQKLASVLDQYYPGMRESYQEIVFSREHAYWADIRAKLQEIKQTQRVNMIIKL